VPKNQFCAVNSNSKHCHLFSIVTTMFSVNMNEHNNKQAQLSQTDRAWTVSLNISLGHSMALKIIGNGFIFAFHSNPILYHFRDRDILVENCDFFIPLYIRRPLGRLHQNIAIPFGTEKKLEWCGYSTVTKVWWCITFSTEYRRVSDRQVDILRRHSPRYE